MHQDGILKATALGSLPDSVAVSADLERVEVFGLKAAPSGAEASVGGTATALTVRSRAVGQLYAAVVKVKPFVSMRAAWQIAVK